METLLKEKANYSRPPCTNLLNQLLLILQTLFTKQANLMRRSTVLSLPLQLVFPGADDIGILAAAAAAVVVVVVVVVVESSSREVS
jgi:hypothetical protein